jgi:hypothetical protein
VLAANPHWLVVVKGVEQQQTAGSTWWGGGLADVAAHPITLAVQHQLVYSARDYPASIYPQSWFADPADPANLPSLWDKNWGYLQQQNIAPVLIGEFGTKLGSPIRRGVVDGAGGLPRCRPDDLRLLVVQPEQRRPGRSGRGRLAHPATGQARCAGNCSPLGQEDTSRNWWSRRPCEPLTNGP